MGNVTHYCSIERANESDNNDYYGTSACGLEYFEYGEDNPKYVTCKNCLRVMAKHNKKAKATLPKHSVVKVEPCGTPVCPKCGGSPIEKVNINKHCPYCNHYW